MFAWATANLEKLAQTVAPPPTDALGRFLYAVQRDDESNAQGCLAEFIDPNNTVIQPTKGTFPIHLAALHGMERLIRQLMTMPGANIQATDFQGNTPLHYACMSSNAKLALNTVKLLVTQFQASVVVKNASHQTPYDVATGNSVRQYLLPLQLQQETRYALDNGGIGLPPGIDLGGLRISNSNIAPPPIMSPGGAPPPPAAGNAAYFGTPSPSQGPPPMSAPPTTTTITEEPRQAHEYARTGHSSAAISSGNSKYRPDGFHSSSSDINLQRKYGHTASSGSLGAPVPPPPSSGNMPQAPSSLGANPYALKGRTRYLAYDGTAVPTPPSSGTYNYMMPAAPPQNVTTFTPMAQAPASYPQTHQATYQQDYPQQQQLQQPGYDAYGQQQPYQQPPQAYQHESYNQQQSLQTPYDQYAQVPVDQQQHSSYGQYAYPPLAAAAPSSYSFPPVASPAPQPPAAAASPFAAPPVQSSPYASQQPGFFPPPPMSHLHQTQSYTTQEYNATVTPAKLMSRQPLQHHVSTDSTASDAQDLFAGPSPDRQQTQEGPTDAAGTISVDAAGAFAATVPPADQPPPMQERTPETCFELAPAEDPVSNEPSVAEPVSAVLAPSVTTELSAGEPDVAGHTVSEGQHVAAEPSDLTASGYFGAPAPATTYTNVATFLGSAAPSPAVEPVSNGGAEPFGGAPPNEQAAPSASDFFGSGSVGQTISATTDHSLASEFHSRPVPEPQGGLDESEDGLQDVPLAQDEQTQVQAQPPQASMPDYFSTASGMPPPPFFSQK